MKTSIQEEALANELAGEFYLAWGKERIAQDYLINAYYGYAHWGAKAKIEELERRHAKRLAPILQQQQPVLSATSTVFAPELLTFSQPSGYQPPPSASSSVSATLDLATVLKASQPLSSEIQLDRLLATLLQIVLENAGADKGTLLLPREDQWFVEAVATPDQPTWIESVPLSSSLEISQVLVNTVKRTLKPVVIIDAAVHPALTRDTDVRQQQPKSLLCTPLLQQGRLVAILYLENYVTSGAFTIDRVELLNLLCAQAAISLENARLYEQAQTYAQQLEQSLDFEALLKRITDRVRDSLDEEQILQTAVEELAQGLQVSACNTGIYNAEQTTSTIAYESVKTLNPAKGSTFEITTAIDCPTATHPQVYACLLKGQSCQFCNVDSNTVRHNQHFLSILAVSLVDDQGVLGDLCLFKPSGEIFNDQEVRLVQQVANQCAIALRQSRLYEAAQTQVQELERLNRLKDDFLSTVSHELRTPMSNIAMATQMLEISLNRLGILTDEGVPVHRYFTVLREEGQREMGLINDLLNLTRLDAETEPLDLTEIDLPTYLDHVAEPFVERTHQQQQQLVLQMANNLPPLTTHLPYLQRILTELLNNACKYTPFEETITLAAQITSDFLEICVSNSGVEIPPQECDRIFDKFYRIPNNDPWKHGGTGLGLALVKKMTQRLGETIHVESGNQQTTFILRFRAST